MTCKLCGGWCFMLGKLGKLVWYRCRNCGRDCCKDTGRTYEQFDVEEMPDTDIERRED